MFREVEDCNLQPNRMMFSRELRMYLYRFPLLRQMSLKRIVRTHYIPAGQGREDLADQQIARYISDFSLLQNIVRLGKVRSF